MIVLMILAIAAFTNPNRREHAIYLFQSRDDERGMLVIEQNTKYHNYIFFSTAEQADWKSFGFLGQISARQDTKKQTHEPTDYDTYENRYYE